MSSYLDISVPIRMGMPHWPGDPEFHIERVLDQEQGDVVTVSQMTLGVHTGTHMDAPLHFLKRTKSIDELPLEATIGPARVIEIQDRESIKRAHLLPHDIQPGERVLFKTYNSAHAWDSDDFYENFVYISQDAASYLAECKVRTVGVDYLSVGGFRKDTAKTHYALLGAGIWVIEGLDLSRVEPGLYDLICLPLKLVGSEGAPARAVLRKIE